MAKVLAISSQVVRGQVGLSATVPALQHLGHEVWALPTVLLASRPGLGRMARRDSTGAELAAMLAALAADGCWRHLDAVFTGYFPSPEAVAAAADAIAAIKMTNPGVTVMVDPILGDGGQLYIAEATAAAIRDRLLPLASIATPNRFELGWLSGTRPETLEDAAAAARQLGAAALVVTSARESTAEVATLLLDGARAIVRHSPRHPAIPNGAGDLFAGLLLAHSLSGLGLEASLDASLALLDRVLAASSGRDVLDLAVLGRLWCNSGLD